jgi:hypothetical protein
VLQAALAKLNTRPACVCDLWKDILGIHKLGVSITFITPDWKMWAVCLAVKEFPQRHTAFNISVRGRPTSDDKEQKLKIIL